MTAIKTKQLVRLPDGTLARVTGVALPANGEPLVRLRPMKARTDDIGRVLNAIAYQFSNHVVDLASNDETKIRKVLSQIGAQWRKVLTMYPDLPKIAPREVRRVTEMLSPADAASYIRLQRQNGVGEQIESARLYVSLTIRFFERIQNAANEAGATRSVKSADLVPVMEQFQEALLVIMRVFSKLPTGTVPANLASMKTNYNNALRAMVNAASGTQANTDNAVRAGSAVRGRLNDLSTKSDAGEIDQLLQAVDTAMSAAANVKMRAKNAGATRSIKANDALLTWFREVAFNGKARELQFSDREPDAMIRGAEQAGWIKRHPNYAPYITSPRYDITAAGRAALKQPATRSVKSAPIIMLASEVRPVKSAKAASLLQAVRESTDSGNIVTEIGGNQFRISTPKPVNVNVLKRHAQTIAKELSWRWIQLTSATVGGKITHPHLTITVGESGGGKSVKSDDAAQRAKFALNVIRVVMGSCRDALTDADSMDEARYHLGVALKAVEQQLSKYPNYYASTFKREKAQLEAAVKVDDVSKLNGMLTASDLRALETHVRSDLVSGKSAVKFPEITRVGKYIIRIFTNEGSGAAKEPPHVHVEADGKVAKFWLRNAQGKVELSSAGKFNPSELKKIEDIIYEKRGLLSAAWNKIHEEDAGDKPDA